MGKCLAIESDQGQARTNIALFTGDAQNVYRTYTTDVRILSGVGGEMNAGILVNYYELSASNIRYNVALLDLVNSTFGIYFFNGLSLVPVGSSVTLPGLRVGDWYRLTLTVRPASSMATTISLSASVQGITDPAISATINTGVGLSSWNTAGAGAGLFTRRSRARFSFWYIDLAP
jgi:hypothetical protein